MSFIKKYKPTSNVISVVWTAIVYVVTVQIGQTLLLKAIVPDNVTGLWLPFGLMLGFVLIQGYGIWPGIFFGAMGGTLWVYHDFSGYSAFNYACSYVVA